MFNIGDNVQLVTYYKTKQLRDLNHHDYYLNHIGTIAHINKKEGTFRFTNGPSYALEDLQPVTKHDLEVLTVHTTPTTLTVGNETGTVTLRTTELIAFKAFLDRGRKTEL